MNMEKTWSISSTFGIMVTQILTKLVKLYFMKTKEKSEARH